MLFSSNNVIFFVLVVCSFTMLSADEPKISLSKYVSDQVWAEVSDYLMPDDHPVKKKLDEIFSSSRALSTIVSMKMAGFFPVRPEPHTQLIVTKHPELKGYVIKAYLDNQEYSKNLPEYYYWIRRIQGARKVRDYIEMHQLGHLFKVPSKWIYLLPDEPSASQLSVRKNFILVEDDMEIYPTKTNERLWKSSKVTPELLDTLFKLITEVGLYDAKARNCPFCKDGRIAFVDTQVHPKGEGFVTFNPQKIDKYEKLLKHLSAKNKVHWNTLIRNSSNAMQ